MQNTDSLFEGVFRSPAMARIYDIARMVARSDVPVLITGESGVGKEVFARLIHKHSQRAGQPLIRVNCAALPNDLLEAELFGYERGAFTGATVEKPGKFELANGGAMLLDEIAEMKPHLQAKLLHVVQDGEYSRLGGKGQLKADVRIIACTNRRLEEAVARGDFRDDLYFRLNVIRLKIPPLRERKQEIPLLSNYFIRKYREQYESPVQQLPPEVLKQLMDYDWPGNVRELENVIKRYLILSEVDLDNAVLSEIRTNFSAPQPRSTPALPADFSSLKQVSMHAAEQAERELILLTLEHTNWNRKQAARRMNICYKALLNKMKKWQLEKPTSQPAQVSRPESEPVFAGDSAVCVNAR
jgi:transcriptional regulator with PAS, ATPase and Fis domain